MPKQLSPADSYALIIASYAAGSMRLLGARIVCTTLTAALLGHHLSEADAPSAKEAASLLASVKPNEFGAWAYVNNASHLVYATTLLDTFLTDTTLFMLLSFPAAIGAKSTIPLSSVLQGTSRGGLITQTAAAKAREVSFMSFGDRLAYLQATFGLDMSISDDVLASLVKYSQLRNDAVHDQGLLELSVDDDGALLCDNKACWNRPTDLDRGDVDAASSAYRRIVLVVAEAIMRDVLKSPEHEVLLALTKSVAGPDA